MKRIFCLFAITLTVAGCSGSSEQTVVIQGVVDPITFVADTGERIRLIGIRSPSALSPIECYGKEALLAAESLLGQTVRLETEPLLPIAEDGALPRYIFLQVAAASVSTGTGDSVPAEPSTKEILVNERALEMGTAFPFASEEMLYGEQLIAAARYASATKRGLWSACSVQVHEAPQGNWLHTETMNDCVIKATQQPDGSKMYRTPQCSTYAETIVLQSQGGQWFCTQDAAENAGYALANDCE